MNFLLEIHIELLDEIYLLVLLLRNILNCVSEFAVVAKQSKAAFLAEVRGTGTSSSAVGSKRSRSSASAPPFKFGTSESQVSSSGFQFCLGRCTEQFIAV